MSEKKIKKEIPDIEEFDEQMRIHEEEMRIHEEEMRIHEEGLRIDEEERRTKFGENIEPFPSDLSSSSFFFEHGEVDESNHAHLKSISIRGVNAEIYDQFVNKMKTIDLNIGDAITKLMKDVISSFDKEFPELSAKSLKLLSLGTLSISHHNNLTISKKDLLDTERAINFIHCSELRFEPDVDQLTFLQFVKNIMHCNRVQIPKILPKLLLLSRIRFCENVEFYEVD